MDQDKFLERLNIDKTMPKHLKAVLKYLKERSNFSMLSDKDTINYTIDYIYSYWQKQVNEKEESRSNDLVEWFRELTYNYNIRDIYSEYFDENTEDIIYRLEGIKLIAPFGRDVLVLAKLQCQKCRDTFFAILGFSFYSHYFEEPITYRGYSSPLMEFQLNGLGYLEASKAFFDLLRRKFLAESYSTGQSLLTTFKTKADLDRLRNTGQYSEVFLARELPIDLQKDFNEYYWNLKLGNTDKPPHTQF